MLFRARRAAHRAWFDFACRGLLRTTPLVADDDGLTLVSMVCHGECIMYLLAVKSFCRQVGRVPQVVLLNDGSLTEDDISIIHGHLPHARIVDIATVSTGTCPKGSCWERLMLIASLVESSYVVQLDCDTLTLAAVPEVVEAIGSNRSFTLLGDRSYPQIEPMAKAWERLRGNSSHQVQAVCERTFDQLPEFATLNYVRGNAGFVGFARGSIPVESITWFSDRMRRLAGDQWDEWGSEQLTSNLLIANTPGSLPLSVPKYLSYWAHPEIEYERSAFLHFIGPYRYSHGLYVKLAKQVIAAMTASGSLS